jgi:hypothetical protein
MGQGWAAGDSARGEHGRTCGDTQHGHYAAADQRPSSRTAPSPAAQGLSVLSCISALLVEGQPHRTPHGRQHRRVRPRGQADLRVQ